MDQTNLETNDLTETGHIMMLTRTSYYTKEAIDNTIQTLIETQATLHNKLKTLRPAF
jgi:hypothetical protein